MFYCERCGEADCCERFDLPTEPVLCDSCYKKATRKQLIDVFMHIGDHITNRDEYGICFDTTLAKAIEDVFVMLKSLDANDSVQVVRCKDCKHWISDYKPMPYCRWVNRFRNADDFCSYGERRTNERKAD